MSLDEEAQRELEQLAAHHRLRQLRVVDGKQGALVELDGRSVINLASNDYLGLAGDPRLARAAADALESCGVGAGASRLIVGNHRAHAELEAAIADWTRRDGVRLFNSGYAANTGILTALLQAGDVVFSDELNHASIIDGCRLSRAQIIVYPHRDLGALERALDSTPGRRRIVVSESLFSMDGDIADVEALSKIARVHDAALMLDEAHAIGVHGPEGAGIAAEVRVVPDILVGTLGKALGVFGAFAATSRAVADLLLNRARPFVFSTALPPSVAEASRRAVEIVRGADGDQRRRDLHELVAAFRKGVPRAGGDSRSAIIPIGIGRDDLVVRVSEALLEAGAFVPGIRPPTVPAGTARLRVSLSSVLSLEDIIKTADIIGEFIVRFT